MFQELQDRGSTTYDNVLVVADAAPDEVEGVYTCIVRDSLGRNSEATEIQIKGMDIQCFCIYTLGSSYIEEMKEKS